MNENDHFYTVRGYEILDKRHKVLTHSMEDYLEMIYRNSVGSGYTRINELADSLHVQAPSATKMVQKLHRFGLLHYKRYGIILLTAEGARLGIALYHRHLVIERFLQLIGVEKDLLMNTELIEHSITNDTLTKIERLLLFIESRPELFSGYRDFLKNSNE